MRIVQYVMVSIYEIDTSEFERFGSSTHFTINFIGLLRFCLTRRIFLYGKSLGTLTLITFILKVEQAHEDCVN